MSIEQSGGILIILFLRPIFTHCPSSPDCFQAQRLSWHPSLIMWAGNNENEQSLEWFEETRNNLQVGFDQENLVSAFPFCSKMASLVQGEADVRGDICLCFFPAPFTLSTLLLSVPP